MKFLRVVGVSGVTMTSGSLFVGAGCGFGVGLLAGVAVVGTVVLLVGLAVVGGVVLLVGVDFGGGVTVIAGVIIPIVRLVAHNMAITPGLMLFSFMVSAILRYVSIDYC